MKLENVKSAYKRYAPIYDIVFGKLFNHGRKETLKQLQCNPGEHILEVGVGTGISLLKYPKTVNVVGIDVSTEMLAKAEKRIAKAKADHLQVKEMDAEAMDFEDNSFDKVVLMYVASVVPNPEKLMQETKRVCKPDGEIFILNHFSKEGKMVHFFEKRLSKIAEKLGWQPDFKVEKFISENDLQVENTTPVNIFGYWTLLQVKNNK